MSTIAEKIFARASGKGKVEAGDIVMADIDIAMVHLIKLEQKRYGIHQRL